MNQNPNRQTNASQIDTDHNDNTPAYNRQTDRNEHADRRLTLIMLILSLSVVFGGWFFTKQLLEYNQTQLLARSGQLYMAESGYSLFQGNQIPDTDRSQSPPDTFHGIALSEDQIAEILTCWESGGDLLSHEPQNGQMNMEQAIAAGTEWIYQMSEQRYFPHNISKDNFQNVSAVLNTPEVTSGLADDLYGRWNLTFTLHNIRITLSIHAYTGQVWQAELVAQSSLLPYLPRFEDEEKLLTAAFPFIARHGAKVIVPTEEKTYSVRIISAEQKIIAKLHWNMVDADQQKSYIYLTLSLQSSESLPHPS